MTFPADLKAIRERVEGATEGPWTGLPDDTWWLEDVNHRVVRGEGGREIAFTHDGDAEFIAHARTDLPRLLDAVEKVLAELDHASTNGHHLDRDCQGVGPGERVPAVRIENIEAAINTALEGK